MTLNDLINFVSLAERSGLPIDTEVVFKHCTGGMNSLCDGIEYFEPTAPAEDCSHCGQELRPARKVIIRQAIE